MTPAQEVVKQIVEDVLNDVYVSLLQHSEVTAHAFYLGANFAGILMNDPLLREPTEAILVSSPDENPRGYALHHEIHERIKERVASCDTAGLWVDDALSVLEESEPRGEQSAGQEGWAG